MSVLKLDDNDIKQAVVQYYEDHQKELYEKYDFENIEVYYVMNAQSSGADDIMNDRPVAAFSIEVKERKS